jgi:hypothetical protein
MRPGLHQGFLQELPQEGDHCPNQMSRRGVWQGAEGISGTGGAGTRQADYQECQIKQYIKPLNQFVKTRKLQQFWGRCLRQTVEIWTTGLTQRLADLNSPILPARVRLGWW